MQPLIFKKIDLVIPKPKIYRRLGYRDGITALSSKQKKEIEEYIEEASSLICLQGSVLRLAIKKRTQGKIILSNDVIFKSKNLSSFLGDSREVLLMAASGGSKIMHYIKEDLKGRNMARAVVLDAAASETTDFALDWMMKYFNRQLLRENKYLSHRRLSCGYADFSLENQKQFYRLLRLERLGIKITRDYILVPEKSVTAITGIKSK